MTLLLEYKQNFLEYEHEPAMGEVYTIDDPTFEQVKYFVNNIKPRLAAAKFTLNICDNQPNIILGEE